MEDKKTKTKQKNNKKKQDETGHFSNGIQCAAMARDKNTCVSFWFCSVFPMLHYQTVF